MDEQVDRQTLAEAPATRDRAAPARTMPAPRARGRAGWAWLVLLLVVALAGYGVWRLATPRTAPATATARAAPPQPVGIAIAVRGQVRAVIDSLGTVTPLATITVKTQIAGQLQQIGFVEGQRVHTGDFLAQIDPRPYQAALEQYEGQLAKDQATLKQAQLDLARYQTLVKQDSIARQTAEDQIYVVQQDQGAIRVDQANIDNQKLNLIYCRIVAPVDGRVGLRQVDAGNYVQTSDPNGIVVLTQLQPISVLMPITEDDLPRVLARVHDGAKLRVTVYDRANVTELATGEISNVDNQIDTTTGMVKLRAMFPNTDESLFPNQFVNAHLVVDTLRDVVTVPVAAIQRGAPGTYVYLVGADSTVAVRPVAIGVIDGDTAQVVSGLAAGDRVVTDGTDRLRAGVLVSARQDAPAQGKRRPGAAAP